MTRTTTARWSAAVLAVLSSLCGPAAAADRPAAALQPLTISEATAEALHWGLRLSPSGRYLALLRRQEKKTYIVVADLQDTGAKAAMHSIPHSVVRWIAWDSDDRLLVAATFWSDARGQPVPLDGDRTGVRVVRMLAMDRDGQNRVMLFADNREALYTRDLAQVTDFLPDDPRHIIVPAQNHGRYDLFRVDTQTGTSERIGKGTTRTFYWFTDRQGYPAFRIDENWSGTLAYVYARKGPGDVPAEDLVWEVLDKIPLRGERNTAAPDFYPLYPGPQPNSYYVAARPDGADTSGIYLYDFIAKKYLQTLATEPGIDVESMFVDRDSHAFLGAEYYAERKVLRLVDPDLQAQFKALDKYFAEEVDVYLADHDRDRATWLLYTVGPRDRGSWHIYRRKEKFVREIAEGYPPLDTRRLGRTRVLRYRARDGLEIMGYLTTPPIPPAGNQPPPLIMLPHGGPELRDYFQFNALVQLLASRGYQVFQPNFRGSSGFGKRFAAAGKRQWGGAMQDDLTDALAFLVENGYAAKDRACIVGASYGGYAALAAATLTPDLYRCAISIAGVSDLPLQLKAFRKATADDGEAWKYVKAQIGDPDDDEDMLEARSPARLAGAVKIPVLMIHGEADDRVPIEHSKKMEKVLRKAGRDVGLVRIKDAGHVFYDDDLRKAYVFVLDFLDKHLPTLAATADTPAPRPAPGTVPSPGDPQPPR